MKLAWLFPGQGAQAVGMGKDVVDSSPAARAVFERADEALGEALSKLCFEGPMDQLTLTANTQPAIVTTSAAILAAVRERLPELPAPAFAAGHSLGEYSALWAAGALSLADAVKITRVRGEAMQEAVPPGRGAMAAIMNLGGDAVAELCTEAATPEQVVSCANFNAPTQTVIAGHQEAVARVRDLAKAAGGKAIPLNVSAPFHCSLMQPAQRAVERALAEVQVSAPTTPVLANVDALPKEDGEAVKKALVAQVDSPVQWVGTIEKLRAEGVTHALELGPGRVLAGLARRIDKDLGVLSVGSTSAIDKIPSFLGLEE
ncbi:MAG TPA: [acyl-carrier-protein] S-malonyltransferase [Polyangiaceae bacterium]|nr:[acyl-carrier-protein] S-malonyltransferase [Polyangiaceae bacterium]